MSDLINCFFRYEDLYIVNLSLLKEDKKFLNTYYITTVALKKIVISNTVIGNTPIHIKLKLVDSIDTYIGKLCLLKKVIIKTDKIYYVLLCYDNVVELISQKEVIVQGDCLNFMYSPNLEYFYIDNLNILEIRSLYKFKNCDIKKF